ncbi:MAG: acyl carrier protein [Draconibacterium sp.]
MEDRKIRRNLYRVLRKTGVEKKNINVNATFQEDFRFDTIDWTIFTYFLECVFNISVREEELYQLGNVKNTIQFLGKTA